MHALSKNAAVARMQAYIARPAYVMVADTNVIESARYYRRFCAVEPERQVEKLTWLF
jgi:hypothetical protein